MGPGLPPAAVAQNEVRAPVRSGDRRTGYGHVRQRRRVIPRVRFEGVNRHAWYPREPLSVRPGMRTELEKRLRACVAECRFHPLTDPDRSWRERSTSAVEALTHASGHDVGGLQAVGRAGRLRDAREF